MIDNGNQACNTCRLRKVKYATSGQYPSPKDPRKALQNPLIARYFHHYITQISPWYDLSDSFSSFGTIIPEAALDNPLPFAAILAVAAVHTSQTTAPSAKAAAEFYHGHCVRLLIQLTTAGGDEADAQGLALASVCLLRSYEILSEEVDPNRHLRGAYSLAAYRSPLVDYLGSGLRTAGFWNYLREDITFSLFERCPLKIDLKLMPLPTNHDTDHSYLNTVSLILGQVVNECFTGSVSETAWEFLFSTLQNWLESLPKTEVRNNLLGPRNLEIAVRHLHSDGLVVVEDVVPHEDLDALNEKMVKDARYLQSLGEKGPFNYNQGNLQQDPPPVAEYFYKSVFANPIATQITSSVLGPRPKWTFCSANAAMPPLPGASPQRQPVHADADFAFPAHPFALVVNVPLVDMIPENGSTELWLGTHGADVSAQEGAHGERASGRIREDLLEERRAVRGPSQPVVKKGSVVVRDLRLWHAGMPNLRGEVRVMLAMIHFAGWYRNPMRLQFAEDVRPLLAGLESQLEMPVDWMSREEVLGSYLGRGFGNSYDFDQAE
ncbi:phytanoyl- dioxygenase [Colletotrichum musicola]|uniref:Phytanoyl- dioxygenase n=1 Tax=Colletotrichum musicola TaxID=2175873 RepID=A0A8H6KLB1_9PEZI|nr:phytanoyl- dioxygenase [Colletotrichum musicola]